MGGIGIKEQHALIEGAFITLWSHGMYSCHLLQVRVFAANSSRSLFSKSWSIMAVSLLALPSSSGFGWLSSLSRVWFSPRNETAFRTAAGRSGTSRRHVELSEWSHFMHLGYSCFHRINIKWYLCPTPICLKNSFSGGGLLTLLWFLSVILLLPGEVAPVTISANPRWTTLLVQTLLHHWEHCHWEPMQEHAHASPFPESQVRRLNPDWYQLKLFVFNHFFNFYVCALICELSQIWIFHQ